MKDGGCIDGGMDGQKEGWMVGWVFDEYRWLKVAMKEYRL